MLTLRDAFIDLSVTPPQPVRLALTTPAGTPYTISVTGIEDDQALAPVCLNGTIDWNDGTPPVVFPYTTTGTLALVSRSLLKPGFHNIGVYIKNYRTPVYDEVQVNFAVSVIATTSNSPIRYLYGPILPKDEGYPNTQQWNFNLGSDMAVLISSVKMLLETQIGERIMEPEYGTDIRSLLFDLSTPGIETLIQEKITQALVRWEPRVSIAGVAINRNVNRSVTVYASLVSQLNQQSFEVTTTFSQ